MSGVKTALGHAPLMQRFTRCYKRATWTLVVSHSRGQGMQRPVDEYRTNEDLGDQALRLADEGFEERVGALIAEARGDRARLALAAARLSSSGPTHGDSKEQIAFALLIEAAHRTAADGPHLKVSR